MCLGVHFLSVLPIPLLLHSTAQSWGLEQGHTCFLIPGSEVHVAVCVFVGKPWQLGELGYSFFAQLLWGSVTREGQVFMQHDVVLDYNELLGSVPFSFGPSSLTDAQ